MIFLVFITVIIVYLLLSQILGDADSPIEYNTGIFLKVRDIGNKCYV